ncbi:MAG: hypothetical protein ACJ8H8_33660 [Geminicoccaceae bacterium]
MGADDARVVVAFDLVPGPPAIIRIVEAFTSGQCSTRANLFTVRPGETFQGVPFEVMARAGCGHLVLNENGRARLVDEGA